MATRAAGDTTHMNDRGIGTNPIDNTNLCQVLPIAASAAQADLDVTQNPATLATNLNPDSEILGDTTITTGVNPEKTSTSHTADLVASNQTAEFENICSLAQNALDKYHRMGQISDIQVAMGYYQDALTLPFPHHYLWPIVLSNLANCHRELYEREGDVQNLEESVRLNREALRLNPEGHPDRSISLSNLANCLGIRYRREGAVQDLEEAIQLLTESLLLRPAGHPDRPSSLNNLANCLLSQYERHGTIQDLEGAIRYHREALQLRPERHPDQPASLANLANCLWAYYEQKGVSQDVEEAIQCHKKALLLCTTGHSDRSPILNNLANCFKARYEKQGDSKDMAEAIQYHREALQLRPPGHPSRSASLINLAGCLQNQYGEQGAIQDLDEAIQFLREALSQLPNGHPHRSPSLNNLAVCLLTQYELKGNLEYLKEATTCHRESLLLRPVGHPGRSSTLNNLATCLQTMYEQQGDMQVLEQAIQCHREALLLCTPGHQVQAVSLSNLAACLRVQYAQLGTLQDLEEAIRCHREALLLQPIGHPGRISSLISLSNCLHTQFEQQGDLKDVEEAIQCLRNVLEICPTGHPGRSMSLNSLAVCLHTRYEKNGDIKDLEDAIDCLRQTLALRPPGNPLRSSSLNNLGNSLRILYGLNGAIHDLEEAIKCYREAVLLQPLGHPDRTSSLNNLAGSIKLQHERQGDIELLEEVIWCVKEAIQACHPNHPSLASSWAYLAAIYADNAQILPESYNANDYSRLFELATSHPTASLIDKFQASLRWIKAEKGPSRLLAYQKCLELADRYILIRSSITSRHQLLSTTIPANLASNATAAAIEAGDLKRAVEFSEQGRTLLWSQLGRYRTPLDALQEVNPDLAAEFTKFSQLLEASATASVNAELPRKSMEEEASKYRRVADDWNATVEKIRHIDGFDNFLKPTKFTTLQQASENGPVIIINICSQRCDAIIIQKDVDPALVPLVDTYIQDVHNSSINFSQAIRGVSSGRAQIVRILQTLWDDIVRPVVDKLEELKITPGSRIWWCPTSELAMLPLHGAGPHRRNKPNLPDMYISSYTPTLSALLRSLRASTAMQPAIPQLLLVAQSETPGQLKIPCVKEELSKVKETVPSINVLLDEIGTHGAVLAGLQTHKSCFHLHDKPLTLLDIIQARLPDAQYAFLSACHSAAGDRSRPDETIHLAAGLQFSGFRSVIGTMYAMADIDGPIVAKEVYKYMFRRMGNDGALESDVLVDYRDAAKALNIATKVLKNSGVPPERWINFIHIGA